MSADINWDSELKWRPGSYAEFDDPVALVLNGIRGQMRREMARDMLTAEGEHREFIDTQLGPIQPGILEERADEKFIQTMSGFQSPVWMGGELTGKSVAQWRHLPPGCRPLSMSLC